MNWLGNLIATFLVSGGLVASFLLWANHEQRVGEQRATVRYELAIGEQKTRAATALALETAKVNTATKALNDFKADRELQDAKNKITVVGLERRLAALAGPTGRLRDPNALADAGCGRGGGGAPGAAPAGAGDRAGNDADGAGLLSKELSGLLLRQSKIADAINLAYASCRPDAINLREALK